MIAIVNIIERVLTRIDDGLERIIASVLFVPVGTLCIGFLGGVWAVSVDADHIASRVFNVAWTFSPFNVFGFGAGRNLHSSDFLLGCCVIACAGGLLSWLVLKYMANKAK